MPSSASSKKLLSAHLQVVPVLVPGQDGPEVLGVLKVAGELDVLGLGGVDLDFEEKKKCLFANAPNF